MMSLAVLVGFAVWVLVVRIAVFNDRPIAPHVPCSVPNDFDGGF